MNDRTEPDADERPVERVDFDAHRLAAIVSSSDDAIISKDLDGVVTSWNPAAERLFGYTASEMIGQSIRRIIPSDRLAEEDDVLAAIRQGNRVDHFETLRRRKDGSLVPISLMVSPVRDPGGRVIGASKIARDISDRRRAEAEAERVRRRDDFLAHVTTLMAQSLDYQQALSALADYAVPEVADWCAIDVVGADQAIVNLAVAHVDPARVRVARTIRERYVDVESPYSPASVIRTGHTAFIPDVTDDMLVAAAGGDPEGLRLARSMNLTSYLCVPMIAHDRTLGALTFATADSGRRYAATDVRLAVDVASRTALAIENAQAYEQLESASRLKDEFLATLSHELRTPLNAIVGYARLLRSGGIPADRFSQAIDVMDRNATLLTQIVEDVLDVSRIVSGKTRLVIQPVVLADVLRDAIATIAPAAEARGVHVDVRLDAGGRVLGDPDRLQQVAWNLLSNAVKFTPRDGRVEVHLLRHETEVDIVVRDTGMGIPASFLPHIFERFRQAESGTTRAYGGLGLGLAIARHLVEMQGGTIHAASEGAGLGATFRVTLPLMIDSIAPQPQAGHPPAAGGRLVQGSGLPPNLTGIDVLVVDDDPDTLALFREVLERAGARVTTARSAAEALECLAATRPAVLVADLGLPGMDGFDLIERVRRSSDPALRDMPAAALTAYARSEDRAKALRRGFQLHLAKPIKPAELVTTVATLARRK